MDVISIGVVNKTTPVENTIRNNTLSVGVQGNYKNTKERIDYLEAAYEGIAKKSNSLIIQDAINIMKANAKLNAIAKTARYGMKNMYFDDLLDTSGIDLELSSSYVHDDFEGSISIGDSTISQIINGGRATDITTINEVADTVPSYAVLMVEEENLVVEDVAPYMTSDTTPEPYMVTTSSKFNNNYSGWRVFNKSAEQSSLGWITQPGQTTGFIQLDYGRKQKVNAYSIQQGIGSDATSNTAMPRDWVLQGSEDGIYWTELDLRMYEADWRAGEERLFRLTHDADYPMYRLVIDRNNGHSSFVSIHELKFYYIETIKDEERGMYSISRDNGQTWNVIEPNTLFYFDDKISPRDKNLRLKIELPYGVKLLNYGLTWA